MPRRWVSVAALALLACSRAEPPKITPETVKTLRITPSGAEVEAHVDAYNPNEEDLKATSVTTTITMGGKPDVARVTISKVLELPARQHVKVDLPISVQWTDLPTIAELARSKVEAPYRVEGTVEFEGQQMKVSAPFRVEGKMSPAELAQAAGAAPRIETSAPTSSARK